MSRFFWSRLGLTCALGLALPGLAHALGSFVTFESGPVRPLALSPDGSRLFATNTPDNRLEIFRVDPNGLVHLVSVPVGMEPVAVAARTNTEVWVVNHLSDSISIVDLASSPARVVRTLLVGDEPRDIVFAGTGGNRAFITTAHRGQNSPFPRGEYDVEGAGRADVWVFDVTALGTALGGTPLDVLTFFGDTPRALAASPDGGTVYAAVLGSGNRTTALNVGLVCNGGSGAPSCSIQGGTAPGGLPAPNLNFAGAAGPEVGLIVQFDPNAGTTGEWRDELNRSWNDAIRFSLPDLDVFEIDADDPNGPHQVAAFAGVGTILFNMVVHPTSGKLYISNTEARNRVRFEGPGTLATGVKPPGEPTTVRGHLHEARITVIEAGIVKPRHLNKHIPYDAVPVPAGVKAKSLATPTALAFSADGATLYVAAFGSSKVGVLPTAQLDLDSFDPNVTSQSYIDVSGGGPSGLVVDATHGRLYVLTRFDNSVSVVDLGTGLEEDHLSLHNPEPPKVIEGRPFLYDAILTGSNGEASCSSCHIFGDMDQLAWDLGNPDDIVVANTNPFTFILGSPTPFHPMKGPMTTQSLRGLDHMGPQHWRGDRQGDEVAAFNAFNVAFPGLVGRDEGQIDPNDMQKFTDFALEIVYPPNPIRKLDNSLRPDEASGRVAYFAFGSDAGILSCNGCHVLDASNGFFGGNGNSSFENETQEFKIAHLRNAYQKLGMFGMPDVPFLNAGDNGDKGPQVRGFGFLHDGSIDTVLRFLRAGVFTLSASERTNLEAFIVAFDTTLAPIVGQQVTLTSTNGSILAARIDLLEERARTAFALVDQPSAKECDLMVTGNVAGERRAWLLNPSTNQFQSDKAGEPATDPNDLKLLAATLGQELTYTCTPPGSGTRMALDRDEDALLNRDDSCPADPNDSCAPVVPPVCGNGVIEAGEACDDGNTSSGDGCSALCVIEFCGDLTCNDGETCLDCPGDCGACVCGNGTLEPGEECDDSNTVSGDGCSALCVIEFCGDLSCNDGETCLDCPGDCGACPEGCGDGNLDPGEDCDDGNTISGDGCTSDCRLEPGVQSKDQQKCIVELNKGFARVAKTQGREIWGCIKDATKGKLAQPTLEACLIADARGKVAKARTKTHDKFDRKCLPGELPDFAFTDPNTVNASAIEKEFLLIHEIFGPDLDLVIARADDPNLPNAKQFAKCQKDVAKATKKCQDVKLKEFTRCKKDGLRGKLGPAFQSAQALEDVCLGIGAAGMPDGRGKINKACNIKLLDKIGKKCPGVDLVAAFPGCAEGEQGDLAVCLDRLVECRVCLGLNTVDALRRDCDLFDDGLSNGSCP